MIFKQITATIAMLWFTLSMYGQSIQGVVKDANSSPICYATVVLCSASDTTQVGYAITDEKGHFLVNPKKDQSHLLYVSYLGYKPVYLPAKADQEIILQEDTHAIEGVVVEASRPISKVTATGVLTLVENSFLSDLGTGNDLLQRVPMLTGRNGVYEVFGKGAATIYINNREVRDPIELDNLNSKDIQSVEVITSPGAKYNASVKSFIRIKTIKKQGDGFSMDVRSSFYTWENQDYGNQINTNYRKGNVDVFARVYYSHTTSTQKGAIYQTTQTDTLWRQESHLDGQNTNNALNGTVGINYEIHKDHFVGVRYDIKTSPTNNIENLGSESDVWADGKKYDFWKNHERKEIKEKIGSQANLYYAGKIKKLSISMDADYMDSGSLSTNLNTETSEQYGDRELRSKSDIENRLWAGKAMLSYPICKGVLSAGSEYVNINRKDEYINNDLIGFSSNIEIQEQNIAFFTQYNVETKVGNFSAGVRYENADYDYLVDGVKDQQKSRKYGQWFPSFSYAHRVGEVAMNVNYNSTVQRPSYFQLSNNLIYGNRFTIQTGNPSLKPVISHDVSVMSVWKFLQAQLAYSHQKDAILTWIDRYAEDPKVSVINYRNTSSLPKLSFFIAAAPTWGIYRPQFSFGLQKYWQDYADLGVNKDMKKPLCYTSLNNAFDLPHDILLNLDFSYTSKGYITNVYSHRNTFKLGCSISKSFLEKSLQVQVAVTDFLNQSQGMTLFMPESELKNQFTYDNRNLSLTVRYFLNTANNKYKGRGAGHSAKSRL